MGFWELKEKGRVNLEMDSRDLEEEEENEKGFVKVVVGVEVAAIVEERRL